MLAVKARDPQVAAIPVIMLTALGDHDFVLRCLKLGAKGYVVKPFEKKTLVQKVCKLLRLDPGSGAGSPAGSRGPVVLAVDRDEKQLSSLMEFLMDGCELLTALDVRLALGTARARRPESVWLDVNQPPELLKSFIETLRADGVQHWVALVNRGVPTPPEVAQLGFSATLPKPFIRVEVREFAAGQLGIFQRFLVREGDAVVLSMPGDLQVRRREWQPAVDGEIRAGIRRAVTEGTTRLVVDLANVVGAADLHLVAALVDVLQMARQAKLDTVMAVPDDTLLGSFTNYEDLKGTRCAHSRREALEAGERKAA
jgi:DNA-binding response OmpR family regulator